MEHFRKAERCNKVSLLSWEPFSEFADNNEAPPSLFWIVKKPLDFTLSLALRVGYDVKEKYICRFAKDMSKDKDMTIADNNEASPSLFWIVKKPLDLTLSLALRVGYDVKEKYVCRFAKDMSKSTLLQGVTRDSKTL